MMKMEVQSGELRGRKRGHAILSVIEQCSQDDATCIATFAEALRRRGVGGRGDG